MSVLVTIKSQPETDGAPGFRVAEHCLQCDGKPDEPIHVDLTGVAFEASVDEQGKPRLSFVVPRHIADALGLLAL